MTDMLVIYSNVNFINYKLHYSKYIVNVLQVIGFINTALIFTRNQAPGNYYLIT